MREINYFGRIMSGAKYYIYHMFIQGMVKGKKSKNHQNLSWLTYEIGPDEDFNIKLDKVSWWNIHGDSQRLYTTKKRIVIHIQFSFMNAVFLM